MDSPDITSWLSCNQFSPSFLDAEECCDNCEFLEHCHESEFWYDWDELENDLQNVRRAP